MKVQYKNKKVEELCENEKEAIKKLNKWVAEKLIFTIEFLKNANSLKDVNDFVPFRLHELKGNRKGQLAMDLGRRLGYRLIIEPVMLNVAGIIFYEKINIVEVVEVSNHYE